MNIWGGWEVKGLGPDRTVSKSSFYQNFLQEFSARSFIFYSFGLQYLYFVSAKEFQHNRKKVSCPVLLSLFMERISLMSGI